MTDVKNEVELLLQYLMRLTKFDRLERPAAIWVSNELKYDKRCYGHCVVKNITYSISIASPYNQLQQ